MKSLALKKYLRKFSPTLVSLANLSDTQWQKISDRFALRMKKIGEKLDKGISPNVQTTIYDLVIRADSGETEPIAFLEFIEHLCRDLVKCVSPHHLLRLRNSIFNLLSNFDDERSGYLDPIGEFAALLSVVTGTQLHLKEIEPKLHTGKHADFCFTDLEGKGLVWVEVVNVHFKENKIRVRRDLTSFLSKRIEDKLLDKLNALDYEHPDRVFALLPVVWCEMENIQHHASVFEILEKKYHTLPICVIAQTRSNMGEVSYLFTTVKRALEIFERQSQSEITSDQQT